MPFLPSPNIGVNFKLSNLLFHALSKLVITEVLLSLRKSLFLSSIIGGSAIIEDKKFGANVFKLKCFILNGNLTVKWRKKWRELIELERLIKDDNVDEVAQLLNSNEILQNKLNSTPIPQI